MCGEARFEGRPWPMGYVSLKGAGPRLLARVEDGRWCLEALADGEYDAELLPPRPLPEGSVVRREPLARARVRASGGRASPALEAAPAPAAGPPLAGRARGSGAEPVLVYAVVIATDTETGEHAAPRASDRFAWAVPGPDGAAAFSLPLPAGRLHALELYAKGLALASLRVPARPGAAVPGGVEARLEPAAWLEGRASAGATVWAAGPWDDYQSALRALADSDGRYRLGPLGPGTRLVRASRPGRAPSAPRLFAAKAGAVSREDFLLAPAAELSVDGAAAPPAPPGARVSDGRAAFQSGARERWVASEDGASALLLAEDAPSFAFVQDSDGRWRAPLGAGSPASESVAAAHGERAWTVFERFDPEGTPSVRVLARGKTAVRGERATLVLPKFSPAGTASALGRLTCPARPSRAELRAAKGPAELHGLAAPRVDFYDATGRLAGTAFAPLGRKDLARLLESLDGEEAELDAALDRWPREYAMRGLEPGTYRAVARAKGCRPAEARVAATAAGARADFELAR